MVWPDSLSVETRKGILVGELRQRQTQLLLVGLRLRLDRDLDDRLGELHLLQDHRLERIAQRITGADVLEAGQGDDVAGGGFLDVFAVVRVHQQHAADTFLLAADRIQHRRTGLTVPE